MAAATPFSQASTDLGLGGMLSAQTKDETEEEKRKRKLGLSALQGGAAQELFGGFGKTGGGAGGL